MANDISEVSNLLAAFTAAGATLVAPGVYGYGGNTFYIDTLVSSTVGWITGQGGVSGSGSAYILLSSDGIHPRDTGHAYYAQRIAQAMATVLPSAGLL